MRYMWKRSSGRQQPQPCAERHQAPFLSQPPRSPRHLWRWCEESEGLLVLPQGEQSQKGSGEIVSRADIDTESNSFGLNQNYRETRDGAPDFRYWIIEFCKEIA